MQYILIVIAMAFYGWITYSVTRDSNDNPTASTLH